MLKNLFKPSTIGVATTILTITTFLSNGIGLLRDRIIAVYFGTSIATDTYNASFLIPDTLFNLFIAGALAAAFLPIFSDYLFKDKEEAYKVANTMINISILVILGSSIIAFIFMKSIIAASFPDTTAAMQQDIVSMTRLMLSSAVFFTVSNTIGNILMTYKHFISYSLSPIFYNAGIIFGVIFLQKSFGIYSASIGVIVGGLFHCLIRIIDLKQTEFKYKMEMDLKHPGFRKILKLMWPRAVSLLALQANIYLFTSVGLKIKEGGVAAFNFARNIQSFAVCLFGISLSTAVFPYLSTAATANDKITFTIHVQKTIQRILFFTIPSMIGVMVLARQIIELILGGGAFGTNSVNLTTIILFFFALSIPFESLTHIQARAFYAVKNTITPMIINIITMIIMGFFTIYIAPVYGIHWFSIGFSIGFIFYVIATAILLRKHLENFDYKLFFTSLSKTIAASAIMAIVLHLTFGLETIMNSKLAQALEICIGGAAFFLAATILKSPEISSIHYILGRLIKKPVNEGKI